MNNLRQIGTAIINYVNHQGDGYMPGFTFTPNRRQGDQWIYELDFIDETEHYYGAQGVTKIIPPRMAPPVLSCPSNIQLFVNSQSLLTSYWMHPGNSYNLYAKITDRDVTMLGFEGDAVLETGGCGCRFRTMVPPDEVDPSHNGGGHILFADGTVRHYNERTERMRETWERRAGMDPLN
jgi:prepilin-type processing-associated H-X9-DG protein